MAGVPPGPAATAPPPVYAVPPGYAMPPGYPVAPGYYPSPGDYERTKQVDRTKTGVLLLMIGALIGWLPLGIGAIGAILSLIGAILVILGRNAFGRKHSRDVIIAVVLFFMGIVAGIVAVLGFVVAVAASLFGTAPTAAQIEGAFNVLLIGAIVAALIGGLAQVFFTYEIQNQTGRILLFAGLGATVALNIAVLLLISPLVAAAISSALSGGTYNAAPITALQDQANTYAILGIVADLLWAGAYYLVWSRINKGEIPARLTGSSGPPPMPTYPGMPPQAPPPSGPAPPINPG